MAREINTTHYCSAGEYTGDNPPKYCMGLDPCREQCIHRHRKYPTPEQFVEEYGHEWPDDGPGWKWNHHENRWDLTYYREIKIAKRFRANIVTDFEMAPLIFVCACTPHGPPPVDWRPKE